MNDKNSPFYLAFMTMVAGTTSKVDTKVGSWPCTSLACISLHLTPALSLDHAMKRERERERKRNKLMH